MLPLHRDVRWPSNLRLAWRLSSEETRNRSRSAAVIDVLRIRRLHESLAAEQHGWNVSARKSSNNALHRAHTRLLLRQTIFNESQVDHRENTRVLRHTIIHSSSHVMLDSNIYWRFFEFVLRRHVQHAWDNLRWNWCAGYVTISNSRAVQQTQKNIIVLYRCLLV